MRIDNPSISGSLSFIGGTNSISATSVSLTGSLSGTFEGSFSSTATANISGAFDSVSQSLASDISLNRSSINSLNSASSSYLLNTSDTLDGDLTVTGRITAQEFHTEFVSASIIYESGSTQFGDSVDDTHIFTGSLSLTGKLLAGSFFDVNVVSTNTTASKNNLYILTSSVSIALPSSPQSGDMVYITNRSETTTPVVNRNGNNIMGAAEDFTIDVVNASLHLVYSNTSNGWIIL